MNQQLRTAPIIGQPGRVTEVHYGPCKADNPAIPKGARTWNHVFQTDLKAGQGRRMLAWRIKGEEVANHFHPRTTNKDPEIFEFIYGDVDIHFKDVYGGERIVEIRIPLGSAPVFCTVPPYVWHKFVVLSEKACFEEFQEGPFDPEVNFTADEFELIQR